MHYTIPPGVLFLSFSVTSISFVDANNPHLAIDAIGADPDAGSGMRAWRSIANRRHLNMDFNTVHQRYRDALLVVRTGCEEQVQGQVELPVEPVGQGSMISDIQPKSQLATIYFTPGLHRTSST